MAANHLIDEPLNEDEPAEACIHVVAEEMLLKLEDDAECTQNQQLCSSCRREKAMVICTVCNDSAPLVAFSSNDKIAAALNSDAPDSNEIYFQKSQQLLDADKHLPVNDRDILMRSMCCRSIYILIKSYLRNFVMF